MLRDERAVSAIEFGFLAPLMILGYVGAVELANALTINRRTIAVTATAADLVAQVKTVSTSDLQDITSAADAVMDPYDTTPLKIVLSSVVADQNNAGKVTWSCGHNGGAPRGIGSSYPTPAGLTDPNTSVIVAEVKYAFQPLTTLTVFGAPASYTMSRTFYSRPRKSLAVTRTDSGSAC
jgi:Flp pilus assembly protein TadG